MFRFLPTGVFLASIFTRFRALGASLADSRQVLLQFLVAGAFCWFLASSLWNYPHSLSYFNESIGGPLNGPKHLLGSNVDWGQDLRYLKWWLDKKPSDHIPIVRAIGMVDLSKLGVRCMVEPIHLSDRSRQPSWEIVSVNLLFYPSGPSGILSSEQTRAPINCKHWQELPGTYVYRVQSSEASPQTNRHDTLYLT